MPEQQQDAGAAAGFGNDSSASQDRLRLALEAAGAGLWESVPATGEFVASPRALALHGLDPRAPVTHERVLNALFPGDRDRMRAAIAHTLATGAPLREELRVLLPDSAVRWLAMYAEVAAQSNPPRLIGIVHDLSERKRYEAVLREREEASARLAAIVSASDDAIVSKTLDGTVRSWNRAAERMFGYSADEMIGQSILRIIPPERHSEEDTILAALRRGEPIEHYESVRVRKDGRPVDVSLSVFPIRDAAGRPVAAAKIARDISAQKRAREERRQREAEYRALFEAAGTGNAEVEIETGHFVRVNGKFCEMVGYDATELLGGMSVFDVIHPDDRADGTGVEAIVHRGAATFETETRYVRKDGTVVWVHLTASALRDEAGRACRALASVIDITPRKRIEAALREEGQRKDEFLATLAHELRNPLAPVRNAVQLLKSRGIGESESAWARDVIDRQVERMARLIDDLLDVSRITHGKVGLHREPVDLAKVLLDAVETSRPLIGADAHQLTVALPAEPITVLADITRLSQVFANLLNNAAKFTERGGRIALHAERAGSEAVVTVVDSGIGIPGDQLAAIFDLFIQVRSDGAEPKDGGLGIGLSLARRLVEMHGGSIEATSAGLGRGSTFTVRLPVAAQPLPAPVADADEGSARTEDLASRVLVVDDNRDAAASLAMLMQMMGHTASTAFDGLEAVRAAETFQPDVILLDIGLPKLNGFEACRRIRALPSGDRVLIVAVTGWGQEADRAKAREAGFDDHMVKPVDPRALIRVVLEAARRRAIEAA